MKADYSEKVALEERRYRSFSGAIDAVIAEICSGGFGRWKKLQ